MKAPLIPEPPPTQPLPIVWTIAGTDPGSGAGVPADLKTVSGLGGYGCSVITAIVAQNTRGVRSVHCLEPEIVREQLKALAEDLPPVAIKIGMLGTAEIVATVARELSRWQVPIICDPVIKSSSGTWLLEPSAIDCFVSELAPLCTLITPNWPEVEHVCGVQIGQPKAVELAAERWLGRVGGAVLIKGGHGKGEWLSDYAAVPVQENKVEGGAPRRREERSERLDSGLAELDPPPARIASPPNLEGGAPRRQFQRFWLKSKRVDTRHTHGTGCTLSAAISAAMARGLTLSDALIVARAYVNQGLRTPPGIGTGHGPLGHGPWPTLSADYPHRELILGLNRPEP